MNCPGWKARGASSSKRSVVLATIEGIDGLAGWRHGPVNVWPTHNLFFGGVNAVQRTPDGSVMAVADGRRGGGAMVVHV